MTSIRERIWRIAHGEPDPALDGDPAHLVSLTDPSAAEFVENTREWLGWYDRNEPGAAEGMRRAALFDALAFLDRFGDIRPPRREPEP